MDLHVIIVIACVFLASLLSILFINKFFKSKTYEEAAAEKKAYVEKLYSSTASLKTKKQPRKQLPIRKDSKKEKKRQQQQQQQQQQQNRDTTENDTSDNHSVGSQSTESSPKHNLTKKLHVEFSEPEIVDNNTDEVQLQQQKHQRKQSDMKINAAGNKSLKQRKILSNSKQSSGILINKTDQIAINQQNVEQLNHFETKHPKDVIELKKNHQQVQQQSSSQVSSDVDLKQPQNLKTTKKSNKGQAKVNTNAAINDLIEDLIVARENSIEEQIIVPVGSPRNQTKNKINNLKKKEKDLHMILDKMNVSANETIGVNYLMSIISRSELTRNDIQILIDYLLNRQQDSVVVTHSEWSDDIVQKLRKQLNEKDKALQEEQDALIGMQAKLRDLRNEINAERIHINVTQKAYFDDINAKKTEIQNLNQELQNLNEKFQIERQQYQTKLHHEKQANSQELLAQIQQINERNNLLQNELHQKSTLVNDLQLLLNASHQSVEQHTSKLNELNEICQQQTQKIIQLEKHLNDSEKNQITARQHYDLEMVKVVENEKDLSKVEIRNLQNALDSTKSELNLIKNELIDSKQNVDILTKQLNESVMKFSLIVNQCQEQTKKSNDLKNSIVDQKLIIDDREKTIAELENRLKQMLEKEEEFLKSINEQKIKNNDLRTKNWKLVEALKSAETSANNKSFKSATSNNTNNLVTQPLEIQSDSINDESKLRNLLQRLYPHDVKKINDLTIDDFVEYIIAGQKNSIPTIDASTITTSTPQYNCENNLNNHNTLHNHNNLKTNNLNNISMNDINTDKNINSIINNSNNSCNDVNDTQSLLLQNVQYKSHIDELTKIVTKTENMLINLETQARELDAHWQGIVQSKQEEINKLKTSNGEVV